MKRYKYLAMKLQAASNCINMFGTAFNPLWYEKHKEDIDKQMETAPNGSGFDNGTTLVEEDCNSKKLVFLTAYHHLDDIGYYVKWTDHKVIITSAFDGFDMRITGKNFNGIKEYIADVFNAWLNEDVETEQNKTE